MLYLVKKNEDKILPQNPQGSFIQIFEALTKPFMDEKNIDRQKSRIQARRKNQKAIYIVKNKDNKLYDGKLWNDPDVEFIANMDYMYCLPSWDWWINPMYDPGEFKKEDLNHVPGVYGNSVVFVDNNPLKERYFKETFSNENFEIIDIRRQYEYNDLELFMFYDYYRILLPMKLARELNRINDEIARLKPAKVHFILRGGFLISEFVKYPENAKIIIDPEEVVDDDIFLVDDCIVMTRNLKKMGLSSRSRFHFSCLDCAIPKNFYEKEFPDAELSLPEDLLSIFSCRIFEKNPLLIGVDRHDNKIIYYDSAVRNKFIREIRELQEKPHLSQTVAEMSVALIDYIKDGFKERFFEKTIKEEDDRDTI